MRTKVCDMLGAELPIFAFSHCRDVVQAVSEAGGVGVLGAARHAPEELEVDLAQLDAALAGKPYGVDLVLPEKYLGDDERELAGAIPDQHRKFVRELQERFGIPAPKQQAAHSRFGDGQIATHARARAQWEVARRHRVRLLASALGPAPPDIVEQAHADGTLVAGLVGSPRHAVKHQQAGTDIVVAQGHEAGGHTGPISTFVLVPQVVDAVDLPVLAAGGVGDGRQVAAALALGAQGVWTGSIWLTTMESDLDPLVKDKLVAAASTDATISLCSTGKPVRQLRTPWVAAWEQAGAPRPLPAPLQGMLVREAMIGMFEARRETMGTPLGQVVGMMDRQAPARDVMYDLMAGTADSLARLRRLTDD
ncbi:MAG: nitronate monooxygenase [Micromonosporaceae bacterium]|nr:nitronate monooxygenase [Micromonosporaceae bacterium]